MVDGRRQDIQVPLLDAALEEPRGAEFKLLDPIIDVAWPGRRRDFDALDDTDRAFGGCLPGHQALFLQVAEHHFGTRRSDGTDTALPHQPHAPIWSGRRWDVVGLVMGVTETLAVVVLLPS